VVCAPKIKPGKYLIDFVKYIPATTSRQSARSTQGWQFYLIEESAVLELPIPKTSPTNLGPYQVRPGSLGMHVSGPDHLLTRFAIVPARTESCLPLMPRNIDGRFRSMHMRLAASGTLAARFRL
jgi:hypothetical protein